MDTADAKSDLNLEDQRIQSFVSKTEPEPFIEKLPGDASSRRYYRAQTSTKKSPVSRPSWIVMATDPFPGQEDRFSFLQIQKHLDRCGVAVPKVFDVDAGQGFVMLEDLGDITLLRELQSIPDQKHELDLMKQAIDVLMKMHQQSGPRFANDSETTKIDGFSQRFDTKKLMWEVDFTIEHFYQKHLKRTIPENDLKVIREGFTQICETIDREPTVFTHRDYHSRNLMVTHSSGPRMVMIDFQDARMGPAQYDLASLLRDSYYKISNDQIDQCLRYYFENATSQTQNLGDWSHFVRIFEFMSIQRNFKAIGSFASFMNRRGNPHYLKYIGNTFENIREYLMKYPEFQNLREVLYHYYYF